MSTPPAAPTPPVAPVVPVTPDPAAIVPNGAAPANGATPKPPETPEPEFKPLEVMVDGRKIVIQTKEQLTRALQKSFYADQEIKNAAQAKKGVEALKQKLKTPAGIREVLNDPDIAVDVKQLAIEWVKEAMDEEKLTPEQRKSRELETENKTLKQEKEERERKTADEKKAKEVSDMAQTFRTEIIAAMQATDLPQDQMTMDAIIQNMRAAYNRFGKVLPAKAAADIVQKHYWGRLAKTLEGWTPEQIYARFGEKVLDKIQKLELNRLRSNMDPNKGRPAVTPPPAPSGKKKDHLTEQEWNDRVKHRIAGL